MNKDKTKNTIMELTKLSSEETSWQTIMDTLQKIYAITGHEFVMGNLSYHWKQTKKYQEILKSIISK